MNNSIIAWFSRIVIVVLVLGTAWATYFFVFNDEFRVSSLSNFLATVVGIVGGIPVAIWIAQQQQREQESKDNQSKIEERKQRQEKILHLLEEELKLNQSLLGKRLEDMKNKTGALPIPGGKNDLWVALSDGGELQWLNNVELLNKLSTSYYFIRLIISLEKQYFDPHFRDIVRPVGSLTNDIRGADTLTSMWELLQVTMPSIELSLQGIQEYRVNNVNN